MGQGKIDNTMHRHWQHLAYKTYTSGTLKSERLEIQIILKVFGSNKNKLFKQNKNENITEGTILL